MLRYIENKIGDNMKVVKISAIWCSGCLIMNKIWKNILTKYNIETVSLDLDMDSSKVSEYNIGDILPVFIFFENNQEVARVIGEKSEEDLIKVIEELERTYEKNS